MGTFFVSWHLWQDLTFVLACAIVVVFAIGVIKLWWTNRRIRKYEIIDEERRQRLSEMRHCGIDPLATDDIPFGVRALESGIQVEGIWVSQPNTPNMSQVALSTTLVDAPPSLKSKGKERESVVDVTRDVNDGLLLALDEQVRLSKRSSLARVSARRGSRRSSDWLPGDARASTEVETLHGDLPTPHLPAEPLGSLRLDGMASRVSAEPFPYGAAEVFANRKTRKSNAGFEVLPAGVLGPRHELLAYDADESNVDTDATQHAHEGPSKLRKKNRD